MARGKRTSKQTAMDVLTMAGRGIGAREIGAANGVGKSTVTDILSGPDPEWEALRNDREYLKYKRGQDRKFQLAFRELVKTSLMHAALKADKAGYRDLMIGAAVAFDKLRLADGESTANISVRVEEVQSLEDIHSMLLQRLANRATNAPPPPIDVTPQK